MRDPWMAPIVLPSPIMDPTDELAALRWLRLVIAYRTMPPAEHATLSDVTVAIGAHALHLWEMTADEPPPIDCDPIDDATGQGRR